MNLKLILGCSALAFAALGATAAAAADAGKGSPSVPTIAGYIEGHGAWEWGSSTNYNPNPGPTYPWSDRQFGGSARAAIHVVPNWSFQGDAWTATAFFPDGSSGSDSGVSGHVTWRSMNGAAMIGVLGSLGSGGFNSGDFGTAGLEAVINANRWRFYGQAGVAAGLTGDASSAGERDVYGTLSANFFFTPNFFLSANIGTDRWTQSNGDSSSEITGGAKLEFKPDMSPVSFFVAYEGFGFRSDYGATTNYDKGTDQIVLAGIRIPLGVNSLHDLQSAVGLADLNPLFGDLINR